MITQKTVALQEYRQTITALHVLTAVKVLLNKRCKTIDDAKAVVALELHEWENKQKQQEAALRDMKE